MTSERILLGHHPEVRPEEVLGEGWEYRRTSNPASPLLKGTQRALGFNEPTATVMWGCLHREHLGIFDAVLWNIFPFHPYKKEGLLTNRTPDGNELNVGIVYAKQLLELLPDAQVVAIGQKAAQTLENTGFPVTACPILPWAGPINSKRPWRGCSAGADRTSAGKEEAGWASRTRAPTG